MYSTLSVCLVYPGVTPKSKVVLEAEKTEGRGSIIIPT